MMTRLMALALVLYVAHAAAAQSPVLSPEAKDALEEINDVDGEPEIDFKRPDRPVVGVKLRVEKCSPGTFKRLAHLNTLRAITLWTNSTDKKEYDFANLNPLAGMTGLKTLVLEECLSDKDSACLKEFKKLEVLKISGTVFGDETMKNVAGLTQLTTLSVRGPRLGERSRVTDKGLEYLRGMQKLRVLDLCCTQVRGPGLAHLEKLTTLEEIDLEATAVGNDHLKPLAALNSLHVLDLSRTRVTDDGLAHLSGLTQIRRLRLSYCGTPAKKKADPEDDGDPSKGVFNDAAFGQFGIDGVPPGDPVHGFSCEGVEKHLKKWKELQYLEMKGQIDIKEPGKVRDLGRIWPKAVIKTDIKTVQP